MKKIIILGLGLLLVGSVNAQWSGVKRIKENGKIVTEERWGGKRVKGNGNVVTKERNVGDYDGVNVAGFMDVDIVSGKEGKLTIQAEENFMEYIKTEIKNGDIKIYIKKGINLKPSGKNKILITVPVEEVSKVSLAGSGDVNTKGIVLKASRFEASLAGSGDLNLDVDVDNVSGRVAGSGDLRLMGKANSFDCKVAGSGDIHAFDLISEDVNASIAGSGDIRVNCNGTLKARVAGSGDIRYKGNPDKEDTKVAGSGDISKS
ncbi:DUF2807 domain-containing protein [Flavobacteriaceae bacterium R38]|nr:DUF2807 domain-containing protein [Flavobacteriaceae bacterium R38]